MCRKTSEDSVRACLQDVPSTAHRVHYMPFLAYSQNHVTDKLAGSIVSSERTRNSNAQKRTRDLLIIDDILW